MGIKIVPQHASVVPNLTVGENVFLGIWPRKQLFVDWKKLYEDAQLELDKYGLHVDPKVKSLFPERRGSEKSQYHPRPCTAEPDHHSG